MTSQSQSVMVAPPDKVQKYMYDNIARATSTAADMAADENEETQSSRKREAA
jgi:hypothetical protein